MIKTILLNKISNISTVLHKYSISIDDYSEAIESGLNVAKELNISSVKLAKINKELFPERPKGKLKNYILSLGGFKFCSCCGMTKYKKEFRLNKYNSDNLNSQCKMCHSNNSKETQKYRQALYRARKIKAVPPWANLEKIEEIYINCPKDKQVDHIFPLKGVNSCGLHVENNLQYLSPKENQVKGNKVL